MDIIKNYDCAPILKVDCDSRLLVCLCDITADDFAGYIAGCPVSMCAEHKAAKLASLCAINCTVEFRVSEHEPSETLAAAMERLK